MNHRALPALLSGCLAVVSTPLAAGAPQKLVKVYSGSLGFEDGVGDVDWALETSDVWRLSGFRYELRGELKLDVGPCTLVIAKSEDEATGNSAVWAALFPSKTVEGQGDARPVRPSGMDDPPDITRGTGGCSPLQNFVRTHLPGFLPDPETETLLWCSEGGAFAIAPLPPEGSARPFPAGIVSRVSRLEGGKRDASAGRRGGG